MQAALTVQATRVILDLCCAVEGLWRGVGLVAADCSSIKASPSRYTVHRHALVLPIIPSPSPRLNNQGVSISAPTGTPRSSRTSTVQREQLRQDASALKCV